MAELYRKHYGLIDFAGSDNHAADKMVHLAGMQSETEILNEEDFINKVKNGELTPFNMDLED